MEKFKETLVEKCADFVDDHPVAATGIMYVACIAVSIPLCVLSYKYLGGCAGKAAAKELLEAGVHIGYTHP